MTTHHAQGVELAQLATARAQDPHLQALGRLMVASQLGEIRIFGGWWRSWFNTPMPECTARERADMPGYLSAEQMQHAQAAPSDRFDTVFVELMSLHHAGAVRMADAEWRSHGDIRLRIMAHDIRHEQQGEIALMHGMEGIKAVATAALNIFADNVN